MSMTSVSPRLPVASVSPPCRLFVRPRRSDWQQGKTDHSQRLYGLFIVASGFMGSLEEVTPTSGSTGRTTTVCCAIGLCTLRKCRRGALRAPKDGSHVCSLALRIEQLHLPQFLPHDAPCVGDRYECVECDDRHGERVMGAPDEK